MAQAPKNHQTRTESIGKWTVRIPVLSNLGDAYICTVDNVSPGAVIARSTAATRTDAESEALAEAQAAMAT